MQTFLPFPNFAVSASVLDQRRLGRQRLEAHQILQAMRYGGGWSNHPATNMWRGHEPALELYHDVMIREWIRRGYQNTMDLRLPDPNSIVMPWWLGDEQLHANHRARLLAKDPRHYGVLGWTETPTEQNIWPQRR